MDYHILREFADSWGLAVLVTLFLGVIAWAFRPGARRVHDDTAAIPFRHEDRPAPAHRAASASRDKEMPR